MIYRALFVIVLQRMPVEGAHRLAASALRVVSRIPGCAAVMRRCLVTHDPALQVDALGLRFPSPLGVAAGMDKDAGWFESLGLLGFGFVEVGTVTAAPQLGHPMPRVFRIAQDRALLNKMGFPNPGAREIAARLRGRSGRPIVGAIGKAFRADRARRRRLSEHGPRSGADLRLPGPQRQLAEHAGTQGDADAGPSTTTHPVGSARAAGFICRRPASDQDQSRHHERAGRRGRGSGAGACAGRHSGREYDRSRVPPHASVVAEFDGGGYPVRRSGCRRRGAGAILRALGDQLVLISVGGIATPDDGWERIVAGATLIQAYTGFVYGGPGWPAHMNRALAQRVRDAGAASIREMIGGRGTTAGTASFCDPTAGARIARELADRPG